MKVLALLLLCAFAAVQGRSGVALKSTRTAAALGENLSLVHLRIAVTTSGVLNSGAGSLISSRWVLTSTDAVVSSSFIWVRYGVVNVINPSLVTETNTVVRNTDLGIALISINRVVQFTDTIAPVGLGITVPETANFCAFGKNSDDGPGETLNCYEVALTSGDDDSITVTSDEVEATEFDLGAPLVADGQQVGLLVSYDGSVGSFVGLANAIDWIQEQTDLDLSTRAADPKPEDDSLLVKVVN